MDINALACFMREAICTNRSTGAIAPSGPILAERVTEMARVREANVIVEYGPGTGVFTEEILRKKRPGAYFIAMEVNAQFVEATRKRCPSALVHHDCAQHAIKYLNDAGYDGCDAIVSGLPWTVFEESLQDAILDAAYDCLRPGGRFVTFAYGISTILPSGRRFLHKKLPAKFEKMHRRQFVWRNLPPSAIYFAEKA